MRRVRQVLRPMAPVLRRHYRALLARATRVHLAPAGAAAYDLSFDQDSSRATTTAFSDDGGSAGAIGRHGRGGAVLHAFRSLRQRRVPQFGVADRSERARRGGKGRAAPTRRIPAGHGIGAVPARHISVRCGRLEGTDPRRERRRISSRESRIGERQATSPRRVRGRPATRARKLQIALLPRHRSLHARSLCVDRASAME